MILFPFSTWAGLSDEHLAWVKKVKGQGYLFNEDYGLAERYCKGLSSDDRILLKTELNKALKGVIPKRLLDILEQETLQSSTDAQRQSSDVTQAQNAVLIPEKVSKTIQTTLSRSFPSCPEVRLSSGLDPCADLFKASCMDQDASFKNDIKIEDEMNSKVQAALKSTIQKTGKNTHTVESAYFEFLHENGYDVKPKLPEQKRTKLLTNDMNPYNEGSRLSDFFSNFSENCYQEFEMQSKDKKLLDSLHSLLSTQQSEIYRLEKGSKERARAEENLEKLEKQRKDIYVRSIKQFTDAQRGYERRLKSIFEKNHAALLSGILKLCDDKIPEGIQKKKKEYNRKFQELISQKSNQNSYSKEIMNNFSDPSIPPECSKINLYELRYQAVQVARLRNSDHSKTKEFVDHAFEIYLKLEHYYQYVEHIPVSETVYNTSDSLSFLPPNGFYEAKNEGTHICNQLNHHAIDNLTKIYSRFFQNIAKSKPTVEALVDSIYNQNAYKEMTDLFSIAHKGVMNFVDITLGSVPELKNTAKLRKIKDSMAGLTFAWLRKPPDRWYKKEPDFPLPILDFEKIPPGELILHMFQDPSLSFFKTLNAFYNPSMRVGEMEVREQVNLLPALNLILKKDPYAALAVIAHEIGHKIGYITSRINGYDLTEAYAKLLACMKGPESIGITSDQSEEAIADWISAQVMGSLLLSLPQNQRRSAALRVAGFFCLADEDGFFKDPLETEATHPESTLRINGIYGTNSGIREALGCTDHLVSGPFKECTLEGLKK